TLLNPDLLDSAIRETEHLKKSFAKLELGKYPIQRLKGIGQKYFVSYKERHSFSRAVEFCSQQGLDLALPQNEEENIALTQFFGDVNKEAWINADMNNRPLTFTKWGEGQPDKSIEATGCTMLSENGVWRVTHEFLVPYRRGLGPHVNNVCEF
uniref:C-type lectin domain-containing protein n=1 Tax=Dicentrarchus labrax TaxID=13489 RepID=A0A8P4GJA7_DICLA